MRDYIQVTPFAPDDDMDFRRYMKERDAKHEKWGHLIEAQDDAEKLRIEAAKVLVDCNTKLNPLYEMKNLREKYPMARTKDYIKQSENAAKRVTLIQKKGMEQRTEAYKEDLRTYEYMVKQGHIPEAKTNEDL